MAVLTSTALTGITTRMAAASMSAGSILQVVSTVKTDTASTTSSSWSAVSGLSATITPSSSSSKIYIMVTLTASSNAGVNAGGAFRIYKGGSHLSASSGDADSNRITSFGQATSGANQAWKVHNVAYNYLDSPSTTSATTYAIYWRAEHGNGSWLGRGYSDTDNTDRVRTPSTITLMEVAV